MVIDVDMGIRMGEAHHGIHMVIIIIIIHIIAHGSIHIAGGGKLHFCSIHIAGGGKFYFCNITLNYSESIISKL